MNHEIECKNLVLFLTALAGGATEKRRVRRTGHESSWTVMGFPARATHPAALHLAVLPRSGRREKIGGVDHPVRAVVEGARRLITAQPLTFTIGSSQSVGKSTVTTRNVPEQVNCQHES